MKALNYIEAFMQPLLTPPDITIRAIRTLNNRAYVVAS